MLSYSKESPVQRLLRKVTSAAGKRLGGRLCLERLEDRMLFSIDFLGPPEWVQQGPGPIIVEGGTGIEGVGAINAVAVDPDNANHAFVATVNGDIWRTFNAKDPSPNWP